MTEPGPVEMEVVDCAPGQPGAAPPAPLTVASIAETAVYTSLHAYTQYIVEREALAPKDGYRLLAEFWAVVLSA